MPNYAVQPWMARPTKNTWDNTLADGDGTHTGADFFAAQGTPVTSPVNGTVVFVYIGIVASGVTTTFGWRVRVRDAFGRQHGFAHMHTIDVKVDQVVHCGDSLGGSGGALTDPLYKRGAASGPHIHWGVYTGDTWTLAASEDPVPYLAARIKEEPVMAANTRTVGKTNANRRTSPTTTVDNLDPTNLTFNTPYDVKGYHTDLVPTNVIGGTNKWFLVNKDGKDLWSHASTFTDPSTTGITSLDPVVVVPPLPTAPATLADLNAAEDRITKAIIAAFAKVPVPPTASEIAKAVDDLQKTAGH